LLFESFKFELDLCAVFKTEPLDEVALKKLLLQFEKRLFRNQELRIKYPDMPEK
jgi:Catenin-beta-like, Arm-motif containing nuclear